MRFRVFIKRLKNDALYWLTVGVLRLLGWLPTRLLLGLGPLVGKLAHLIAWPERRRARANLQRAELGCDAPAQRRIVRDVFIQLGRSATECVALNAQRADPRRPRQPHGVEARLLPTARESFGRALARGRGVVFVSAHFGNWELLGAAIAGMSPTYVLARQSYDPRFSRLIERFRGHNGMQTIWVEEAGALRRAASALKRGAVVAVLLDQPVKAGGLSIPFLGRPASTSRVAASLARATGAGLAVGFIHRISAGHHIVSMDQLEIPSLRDRRQSDLAVSEALTRRIEVAVRDDPGSWLWTLDRWRPSTDRPAGDRQEPTPLASLPGRAGMPG